jgi:ParB/RepB/Spo0J family partition protein
MGMQVQEIPLAKIKVKDRAREDKGDIESLAALIKEHGLIQPITVDGNFQLIAGERRYLAHRLIGADTIKGIVRDDVKTDTTRFEIELVENIARKDLLWHERDRLELKLYNLKIAEFGEYNPVTKKGWSQHQQATLVGRSQPAVNRSLHLARVMEESPELELDKFEHEDHAFKDVERLEEEVVIKAARAKVPDHIKTAINDAEEHYLIGDALKEMSLMKRGIFDFAEVDPPYGVDLDKRKGRNTNARPMATYREWTEDSYPSLFFDTAQLVYDRLKDNKFAVFWYGMSWHCDVLRILRDVGFGVPDIPAVWTKGDSGQTASPYTTLGSCYEPFFLARKGKPKLPRRGRGNVFDFPPLGKKDHATEKPIALMEEILDLCLDPGSHILIPFLGSGVTLRAAYRKKHTGIGWDLSQQHKDSFLRRIQEDVEHDKA